MELIRRCLYIHFIVYLAFVPLVAQETAYAKLYLITGIVVEGIIEEVTSKTVRFNQTLDDGSQLIQKIPVTFIYKLISPSGEVIVYNEDLKPDFEKNLAIQDSVKKAVHNDESPLIESYEEEITILNDEQQEEKSIKIKEAWLNVGVGRGNVGIAGGGDFNFRVSDRLISQVSLVHSETFELFGDTPEESVTSFALLVGKRTKGEHSMSAILIGVGAVNGFHRGRFLGCRSDGGFLCFDGIYEKNSFTTIGLVGNIQFYWMPSSIFGIGINITGNINSETSFVVALLSLRLGS